MAAITFLGTANAMPDKDHESAHLLVEAGDRVILVDCAGNTVVRLDQGGVELLSLTDIILTHFHPDHVAGLPLLLLDMWLLGRTAPINIYGLHEVIDRALQMMDLFGWQDWAPFYPVSLHRLPDREQVNIIDTDSVKIWTSLVCHSIPTIGMRMQFPGGTLCYSSDTAPSETLARLAEGVDILIHEATGEGEGHTTPEKAGEIAQQTGSGKLFLIHYPPKVDLNEWVAKVQSRFNGDVIPARDWMTINI